MSQDLRLRVEHPCMDFCPQLMSPEFPGQERHIMPISITTCNEHLGMVGDTIIDGHTMTYPYVLGGHHHLKMRQML